MKTLSAENFERARDFVKTRARPVDQALFAYTFEEAKPMGYSGRIELRLWECLLKRVSREPILASGTGAVSLASSRTVYSSLEAIFSTDG